MKLHGPRNIGIFSLMRYRFPFAAISSILHRLSGVILFIMIPFMLWMLHLSLISEASFLMVKDYFAAPWVEFLVWISLSALFYHFIAGLRHLLMDMGFCEEKISGKISGLIVIVLGLLGTIGIGVWIIC